MKKSFALLLAIMMFISATASFAESNSNSRYFDDETGVSFSVCDDWEIVPNDDGNQYEKVKYALTDNSTVSISFTGFDLWSSFELSKNGMAREEVDFILLNDEVLSSLLGITEFMTKEIKQYGDYQYYVVTYKTKREKLGLTLKINHESAVTLVNGFFLMFTYSTYANQTEHHQEFEDLLNSVSIQGIADNSTGSIPEGTQAQDDQNSSITGQTENVGNGVNPSGDIEWKNYEIDEIGMKFSLPYDYSVYTRNMSDDDPLLAVMGYSGQELAELLAELGHFAEAIDNSGNCIMISAGSTSYSDFSDMTDSGIMSLGSNHARGLSLDIKDTDVYRNGDLAFLRLEGTVPDNTGNKNGIITYFTSINYAEYSIFLRSPDAKISDDARRTMDKFMESVSIEKIDITQFLAYNSEPKAFDYQILDDGTIGITAYAGYDRDVMIPRSIGGHKVTTILGLGNNYWIMNLYIPETIEKIVGNPFTGVSLRTIKVDDKNTHFVSSGGAIYSYDRTVLIHYPFVNKKEVVPAIIPDTVKIIGDEAFSSAYYLKEIILPEGLEKIGDHAFYYVPELKTITIPATVKEIGSNPFKGANALEEIVVEPGNSIFEIYNGALYNRAEKEIVSYPGNRSIEGFTFPDDLQKIGDYAFYGIKGLLALTFPESLTWIGDYSFYNCEDSSFVNLPSKIEYIGQYAFSGASFDQLTIPGTAKLEEYCLANVKIKGKEIIVQEGVTEIPSNAFRESTISSVILPESLETIGDYALAYCTNLKSINIPKSVISIGDKAFLLCSQLTANVEKGSYAETYCQQNSIKTSGYENVQKSNSKSDTSTNGTTIITDEAQDPILSYFPGINWRMTKEDLQNKYGKERFYDIDSGGLDCVVSTVDLYDENDIIVFMFTNGILSKFEITYSTENEDLFLEALTKVYGDAMMTSVLNGTRVLNGKDIEEDSSSEVCIWKTKDTIIVLYLQNAGLIEYWPI